ncbi:winged helix-turn-helix transcriptional regulator [Dyella choica]|uniref:Winged helix-turn-helix transcriptional regulator n=2 Tax=Dyella choica TaxID=1927959 RepID=A0A432M638_9GAMM|nr:winged helix-turn-helix transcriptional regulator [Dyella choica]
MCLKTHPSCSTASLAEALGTTTEAVRQQIAKLVEQGLVEGVVARTGVGRPKQLWQLTAAGHGRFPDTHAQLTVQLIQSVGEVFGQDGVAQMVEHRGVRQLAEYRERMASATSLPQRVARLAQIRTEQGYMAWAERDGADFLLIEDHCPICAAATLCQRLCMSELQQFQALMHGLAQVSREEHLLREGRRCVYRMQPIKPSKPGSNA